MLKNKRLILLGLCLLLAHCNSVVLSGSDEADLPAPPTAPRGEPAPIVKVSTDAFFGLPTFYDSKKAEQIAWHVWRGDKDKANFLNAKDRLHLAEAQSLARLSEVGKKIEWSNPKSGNGGFVLALKEGYDSMSRPCRLFRQVNKIRGNQYTAEGIACKDFDGDWYIIEE